MVTRERMLDRGRRRAGTAEARILGDIRLARRGAGLSLDEVSRPCGLSRSQASRLERGLVRRINFGTVFCLADAVGLDVSMKTYPIGDPLRDTAHVILLERLRARLAPNLGWRTEVHLPDPEDRRAWDAVISGHGWRDFVEAETVVDDSQATHRRLMLKIRDGKPDLVILLVLGSARNRAAIEASRTMFADLPTDSRLILRALGRGERPPGSGIVLL